MPEIVELFVQREITKRSSTTWQLKSYFDEKYIVLAKKK